MTLPAVTRRRCSNRSISPARSAYGHAGTDRRTDGRTPYRFIDPAAHTIMQAVPVIYSWQSAYCDERVFLLFVCPQSYLKNHTSPISMCICCLWPWLGPFLGGVAICYVLPVLCTVSCLYCWSNSSLSVTQQRRSRANAPATWYWMCPIIDNSRCQESVVHENRVRSLRCTLALFRYLVYCLSSIGEFHSVLMPQLKYNSLR